LQTIWELLDRVAADHSSASALLAPDVEAQSFGQLRDRVLRLAITLRRHGLGPSDAVAIVMPNGPDMAIAFLAVSASCAAAPLNPGYTAEDFRFYLEDLNAKAVIVGPGSPATLRQVAGIPILEWEQLSAEANEERAISSEPSWPQPGNTALLLHTSGTTSRPKLVPLTHGNLLASARNIAQTLRLSPEDRCLNIMPLFHIHGLAAALLASLHAGASVICSDGVFAKGFYSWLDRFEPTWYTAVPTMHQGILAQAADHPGVLAKLRLRFIRSSSAALPPPVMAELERVFGAPVVEAYGMTEAAHQMCCNPLPPLARKPGSVGLAAGPEVAVMDEAGHLLGTDSIGEVVIRGANVTPGYLANPSANQAAFAHGWFHTGDQGRIDVDGYLHLTGRLKELINRGGEKIAPREIDEALLAHPGVRQALAFSIPHAQLGEDVGAAVELRAGFSLREEDLRDWAAGRLASFKVPRILRIVEKIPTGPTGKLQRIGLAAKLGIDPIDDTAPAAYVAPRSDREAAIVTLWSRYFPGKAVHEIGVQTRFESLGGDSLLAARMLTELEIELGVSVPMPRFLADSTIACLARGLQDETPLFRPLREGSGLPLLCIPGHDASLLGLTRMAASIEGHAPVWAIDLSRRPEAPDLTHLVADLLAQWRNRFPSGPYRLAGVCLGGCLAWEIAHQLQAAGERVEFLCLIDSLNPAWRHTSSLPALMRARGAQLRTKFGLHRQNLAALPLRERVQYFRGRAAAFRKNYGELANLHLAPTQDAATQLRSWVRQYQPPRLDLAVTVIRLQGKRLEAPGLGWSALASRGLELLDIPFAPDGALSGPNALRVAQILDERLHDA
jgi:acyl-CoA synthetase (AMP-forming)/AMP-acid ligase II/thioesterase domain-containing protein